MNQLDKKEQMMEALKGKIIVSCQALEDEPLHGSFIMGRMAVAAKEGGAAGIRANSPQDIVEIKKSSSLEWRDRETEPISTLFVVLCNSIKTNKSE